MHVPDETNSIKEWSLSNPNGNCFSFSPFSCSFAVTIQVVAYKTRTGFGCSTPQPHPE
ncbi:hypothetical protein ERO13_A11G216550v2 [Gossypium hirsutum]|nr:hypothetical protein ERO13_A11G216550v2 [Gossypium hirsutum]